MQNKIFISHDIQGNHLLFYCYHSKTSVHASFCSLRKKIGGDDQFNFGIEAFDVTNDDKVKEIIFDKINILIKQQMSINKITFAADVNLNHPGEAEFPVYLMNEDDTSMFAAFQRQGIELNRVLESSSPQIVEEAIKQ